MRSLRPHLLFFGLLLLAGAGGCPGPDADGTGGDGGSPDGAQIDGGSDGGAAGLTWYRDALPVVQSRCLGCHVEGGLAPFSLETYEVAAMAATDIAWAVENEVMPPWTPDESCQPIQHSRALSAAERDALLGWVADGALEGDPADAPGSLPPPPGLPRIDREIDAGEDYTPDGSLHDDYHCSIVDPLLTAGQDIVGVEVLPGTPTQVHHVILFSAPEADARTRDAQEAAPGWTCFGGPEAGTGETLAGWAPGTPATVFPAGTGISLQAGHVLIMQVHYHPERTPLPDRTAVRLMFADGPVSQARMLPVVESSFAIPPGATDYRAVGSFGPSPVGATVWGAFPHMHVLGRSIRTWIESPGGAETCLVDIPAWDFNWQQLYFFDSPDGVPVTAGDTVHVECRWDNPGSSTVTWGEGTLDEMCLTFLYVTL